MTDFFNYIDDYKSNSLSAEVKSAFEKEMSKNNKLKNAVENFDLIKKISKSLIEDEAREKINELKNKTNYSNPSNYSNKEKEESKVVSIKPIKKWVGIAATFLFLIVVLFIIKNSLSNTYYNEIKANLVNPPSNKNRGDSEVHQSRIEAAIDSFDLNKFEVALTLFQYDFRSDSLNKIANIYIATIYFKMDKFEKAVKEFKKLEGDIRYEHLVKENLFLCYLLLDDKINARKYFDQIKDKFPTNSERSKKYEAFLK